MGLLKLLTKLELPLLPLIALTLLPLLCRLFCRACCKGVVIFVAPVGDDCESSAFFVMMEFEDIRASTDRFVE